METNSQDELAGVFAMLSALRKTVDKLPVNTPEKYVREYHAVLDRLKMSEIV